MADSLMDYLDQIEDILDQSKSGLFSSKISVEKERIYDVMNDIRLNLPNEIRSAQRIIEDHDKIITDARLKAASILKEAEEEAKTLTNDHEIYRRAAEQASETLEDAKKDAKEMRHNALDYTDEILAETEASIVEAMENMGVQFEKIKEFFEGTVETLYANRQSLRRQ